MATQDEIVIETVAIEAMTVVIETKTVVIETKIVVSVKNIVVHAQRTVIRAESKEANDQTDSLVKQELRTPMQIVMVCQ